MMDSDMLHVMQSPSFIAELNCYVSIKLKYQAIQQYPPNTIDKNIETEVEILNLPC